ncbi:MAG: stage V sporulation protein T [Lachnospiraceae bacterium]|nr:stage V sporulation protein T [Lachnospiraceae bacterium]
MKATGIVRRIDDLGRVVIPKEIRRTLRIREGDPLEIFTDREGEIILQKYSPINELGEFAKQYVEALSQATGHIVCITDRDQVVAISGGRKDLLSKHIHKDLENAMEERETFSAKSSSSKYCNITEGDNPPSETVSPIICAGDVIGSVCIFGKDSSDTMGEVEHKLALSAASFLGKQMEQ